VDYLTTPARINEITESMVTDFEDTSLQITSAVNPNGDEFTARVLKDIVTKGSSKEYKAKLAEVTRAVSEKAQFAESVIGLWQQVEGALKAIAGELDIKLGRARR